jgi:excisionase family DNA binding protein
MTTPAPRHDPPASRGSLRPPYGPQKAVFTVGEACSYLGVSHNHWSRHIAPSLPMVRSGRLRLVRRERLDEWLRGNEVVAADALGAGKGSPDRPKVPANGGQNGGARPTRAIGGG